MEQFLMVEPPVEERVEIMLARLLSSYTTVHAKKGSTAPAPIEFLPHLKAWPQPEEEAGDGRYSELDQEVLRAFR